MSEPDSASVRVSLLGMERIVGRGSLAALLDCELEFPGGLTLVVHGISKLSDRATAARYGR